MKKKYRGFSKSFNFIFSFLFLLAFSEIFCFSDDFSGVWENKARQVRFSVEENQVFIRLKNFYGLWLDTEYSAPFDFESKKLLVYKDELYVRYWVLSELNPSLFVPCANFSEITMDNQATDESVYAFFIEDFDVEEAKISSSVTPNMISSALKIRYWKCSQDIYSPDKVISFDVNGKTESCPKFLKIGSEYYTCAVGRSEKVRNVYKVDSNLNTANPIHIDLANAKFIFTENGIFLVGEKPYLTRDR